MIKIKSDVSLNTITRISNEKKIQPYYCFLVFFQDHHQTDCPSYPQCCPECGNEDIPRCQVRAKGFSESILSKIVIENNLGLKTFCLAPICGYSQNLNLSLINQSNAKMKTNRDSVTSSFDGLRQAVCLFPFNFSSTRYIFFFLACIVHRAYVCSCFFSLLIFCTQQIRSTCTVLICTVQQLYDFNCYKASHVSQVSVHLDPVVGDCQEMKTVCPFAAMGCKKTKVTNNVFLLISFILSKTNASRKVKQQSYKRSKWYILLDSTIVVISVSVT